MPTKSRTAAPNVTTAAHSLAFLLNVEDASRASLAVLLAAADEIEENSRFAARVRAFYEQLPTKATRGSGASTRNDATKILTSTLQPVRHIQDREIDPAAPLDPYFLMEVYGAHQIHEALDLFPVNKLKEGLAAVMERNPGTKPTNKSKKATIIDYMIRHITGEA